MEEVDPPESCPVCDIQCSCCGTRTFNKEGRCHCCKEAEIIIAEHVRYKDGRRVMRLLLEPYGDD